MSAASHATEQRESVYVWEAPVRATHWLLVGAIAVLSVTGFYIGFPFVQVSGPAGARFVMGWMRVVHFYAAIVFTLSLVARMAWMVTGNRYARWDQFIPVRANRRRALWRSLEFYLFVLRKPPGYPGHNALAGAAYGAMFFIFFAMAATGLALYGASAHVDSWLRPLSALLPLLGGAQVARWLHHAGMWLILAFVVQHVYSAVLTSIVERNGELDSIVSGYKAILPSERTDA